MSQAIRSLVELSIGEGLVFEYQRYAVWSVARMRSPRAEKMLGILANSDAPDVSALGVVTVNDQEPPKKLINHNVAIELGHSLRTRTAVILSKKNGGSRGSRGSPDKKRLLIRIGLWRRFCCTKGHSS